MKLEDLIEKLLELIPLPKWKKTYKYRGKIRQHIPTYFFSLNLFENGVWAVTITHDWHKLMDKRLEDKFYGYTPQEALRTAISYIKEHLKEYRKCCK